MKHKYIISNEIAYSLSSHQMDEKYYFLLGGLCVFPLIFSFFGATALLKVLLVVYFIIYLIVLGLDNAVLAYVFLIYFIPITRGAGTTAVAYIGLILFGFLAVWFINHEVKGGIFILSLFVFTYFLRAFMVDPSFSKLTLVYDYLIAVYVREKLLTGDNKTTNNDFCKKFFFMIYLAAIVSLIYAVGKGLNGFNRLGVPIGVDKACYVLVPAMIYPLFYVKSKVQRIGSLVILLSAQILSMSITGVICFTVFFIIYYIYRVNESNRIKNKGVSSTKNKKSGFWSSLLIIIPIVLVVMAWRYGTGIAALDRLLQRIKDVMDLLYEGEYDAATTGRYDIIKYYIEYFNKFSLIEKLFGGGRMNYYGMAYNANYSHNSFIDAIMFIGYIPFGLLLLWNLKSIKEYKNPDDRIKIILLKAVLLCTASSTSFFTSSYAFSYYFI